MWWVKGRRAQNEDDFETWVEEGVVPTLNAFDNATETRATVLIIDGMNGENVPMISDNSKPTETIAFDTQFGSNANTFENVSPTLKASQQPPSFIEVDVNVYPIQDSRDIEKAQWGMGVRDNGSPSYTIDTMGVQGVAISEEPVAYSIREDAKANNFSATETDTALALQANRPSVQSHHAQLFIAQDEPIVMRDREGKAGGGKGPLMSKTAFTLATSNFHTIFPNSTTVRRLTPLECERLQGFPDNWTGDQADSNRYKQMGNAVAVPVVQWIIDGVMGNRDE